MVDIFAEHSSVVIFIFFFGGIVAGIAGSRRLTEVVRSSRDWHEDKELCTALSTLANTPRRFPGSASIYMVLLEDAANYAEVRSEASDHVPIR